MDRDKLLDCFANVFVNGDLARTERSPNLLHVGVQRIAVHQQHVDLGWIVWNDEKVEIVVYFTEGEGAKMTNVFLQFVQHTVRFVECGTKSKHLAQLQLE